MPPGPDVDPTPLAPAQIRVLLGAAWRELSWGLSAVAREVGRWRALAAAIPDRAIREDARYALSEKRAHADGAALFTVIPRHRDAGLLALLVAYETIVDFLDNVSERHPTRENGRQLHLALTDALNPGGPVHDYYRFHPWRDDGGFLLALVHECRARCCSLPSFEQVWGVVSREARRSLVLGINHDPSADQRDDALRAWAAHEFPDEQELCWFELSGAASATLVVHGLLTLAAEPRVIEAEVAAVYAAYWPWTSLATTMLDSYVDQADDAATGNHSYIGHYADTDAGIARLRESIRRALLAARALPDGEHHAVIVGCMIAMYLSKPEARSPGLRATTLQLAREGGSLVRLLLPILRAWRFAYAQRAN
jgi:tetraprenyl-beta-curcumene synthase